MKSGKQGKGKIPHLEWEAIARRHAAGEALTSIARAYGCTAPAIRYIVRRQGALQIGAPEIHGSEAAARGEAGLSEGAGRGAREAASGAHERDGMRTLSTELRERVGGDIAGFLVAFDAASAHPSALNLDALQTATDRLMRTAARTRIELEHLRDAAGRPLGPLRGQVASS
jgi:hypothetical protein